MNISPTLLERLNRRRTIGGPDECWPHVNGSIRINWGTKKTETTELRRAVWLLEHGSFPGHYQHIEVLCGNHKCLNPKHLKHFTEEQRFWRYVDRSAGPLGCWPWTGSKLRGYGRFQRGDHPWAKRFAHRYAYELAHGPIVQGPGEEILVMHSCDNPPCCNPAHLSLGTDWDNIHDCIAKGRNSRGEKHSQAVKKAKARQASQAPSDSTERK